jgi:hypothetical protein
VSLDEGSNRSDPSAAGGPIDRGQSGHELNSHRSQAILADVTSLLRDLCELIESYGPAWYTERMDTRVRSTLAAAEAAVRVSID